VCHIIKLQVNFFKRNKNTQGKSICTTQLGNRFAIHHIVNTLTTLGVYVHISKIGFNRFVLPSGRGIKPLNPKPHPPPVGSHSRCTPVTRLPRRGRPDSPRTSSGRNTGPGTPLRPAAPTRCRSHGSPCTSSGRRGTSSQTTAPCSPWFLQENRTTFVKQHFLIFHLFYISSSIVPCTNCAFFSQTIIFQSFLILVLFLIQLTH